MLAACVALRVRTVPAVHGNGDGAARRVHDCIPPILYRYHHRADTIIGCWMQLPSVGHTQHIWRDWFIGWIGFNAVQCHVRSHSIRRFYSSQKERDARLQRADEMAKPPHMTPHSSLSLDPAAPNFCRSCTWSDRPVPRPIPVDLACCVRVSSVASCCRPTLWASEKGGSQRCASSAATAIEASNVCQSHHLTLYSKSHDARRL